MSEKNMLIYYTIFHNTTYNLVFHHVIWIFIHFEIKELIYQPKKRYIMIIIILLYISAKTIFTCFFLFSNWMMFLARPSIFNKQKFHK